MWIWDEFEPLPHLLWICRCQDEIGMRSFCKQRVRNDRLAKAKWRFESGITPQAHILTLGGSGNLKRGLAGRGSSPGQAFPGLGLFSFLYFLAHHHGNSHRFMFPLPQAAPLALPRFPTMKTETVNKPRYISPSYLSDVSFQWHNSYNQHVNPLAAGPCA